ISDAISKKHLYKETRNIQKKKSRVIPQTSDTSEESKSKIASIRNFGKNRALIIIANGPSITEIQLDRLKGQTNIDMLSINSPDKRVWPTTFWAFFDPTQLLRHKQIWDNYEGTIFNSTSI